MRNFLFIIVMFVAIIQSAYSQTITNPSIKSRDEYSLNIDRIELTDYNTIIYCTHTAPSMYVNGGWVTIQPNIFLKETYGSRTYKLLKAEGIPLSPNKFNYSYKGQTLSFKLIFQKIATDINLVDLIECQDRSNCFNFYGIKIRNENSQSSTQLVEKFRVDYNYVAVYDKEANKWSDWKEGFNTFVVNINNNGNIMHVKANGEKVIYRKLSGVEEGSTQEGKHYQIIRALDNDGDSFSFQIFDDVSVGLKMMYGNIMIQFAKF